MTLLLQTIIVICLVTIIVTSFRFEKINLPALAVGSVAVVIGIFWHEPWLPSFVSAITGAAIATIFFLWQYLLSRGQWVGTGEAWLGAFIGLLAGWHVILRVAALGYGLAALAAFVMIFIFRKKELTHLPLSAFLSFSSLVFLLLSIF